MLNHTHYYIHKVYSQPVAARWIAMQSLWLKVSAAREVIASADGLASSELIAEVVW
ncbi:MAG: hypothetical protein PsegKO_00330 [Pseudohongiellaceae bacterium]